MIKLCNAETTYGSTKDLFQEKDLTQQTGNDEASLLTHMVWVGRMEVLFLLLNN